MMGIKQVLKQVLTHVNKQVLKQVLGHVNNPVPSRPLGLLKKPQGYVRTRPSPNLVLNST